MTSPSTASAPPPLIVAASLTAIEGVILAALAVIEAATFTSSRAAMGVTTTVFFVLYAAAMVLCAWAVYRGRSWARSPIALTQLIGLGVAWSFRGGQTTLVAVGIAVTALVVLAGLLHTASTDFLAEDGPVHE